MGKRDASSGEEEEDEEEESDKEDNEEKDYSEEVKASGIPLTEEGPIANRA